MSTIIQTNQLTKSYGRSRGIIDVTIDIQEGEVFGFLGPNGAGKTTTMRTLMGLLHANSGSATIGGLDCWAQSTEVNKLVGSSRMSRRGLCIKACTTPSFCLLPCEYSRKRLPGSKPRRSTRLST